MQKPPEWSDHPYLNVKGRNKDTENYRKYEINLEVVVMIIMSK